MTKRSIKFNSTEEFISHIILKLRIKPVRKESISLYVRRKNTMNRIIKYVDTININATYPNNNLSIHDATKHYFTDIWVNNSIVTIRCFKKQN